MTESELITRKVFLGLSGITDQYLRKLLLAGSVRRLKLPTCAKGLYYRSDALRLQAGQAPQSQSRNGRLSEPSLPPSPSRQDGQALPVSSTP